MSLHPPQVLWHELRLMVTDLLPYYFVFMTPRLTSESYGVHMTLPENWRWIVDEHCGWPTVHKRSEVQQLLIKLVKSKFGLE